MNQRINKLAQLAGLAWAEDVGCGFPDIKYPPGYEKFAELIVRECAYVCYDHSNAAGGVNTHFGYGYKDCGDDIKKTFGVK